MKKILVPTDFSECAGKAVDFAIQLARLAEAEIALLHVSEISESIFNDSSGIKAEYNREILEQASQKLELHKKAIEAAENITVTTQLFTGAVNASITQAASDLHADLIVMGTLGAAGLRERIWGSSATHQIGKADVPVLIVPLDFEPGKLDKILFATSHFEESPEVLNPIVELADLFLSQLHVVVFSDLKKDSAGTYIRQEEKLAAYRQLLSNRYGEESPVIAHLAGEDFEASLQRYITQEGIDLLVMVTYQRNFIGQIFTTSHSRRMAYHTRIPLMVIPAKV